MKFKRIIFKKTNLKPNQFNYNFLKLILLLLSSYNNLASIKLKNI